MHVKGQLHNKAKRTGKRCLYYKWQIPQDGDIPIASDSDKHIIKPLTPTTWSYTWTSQMGTWVALACYLSFLYNKPYPKKKLFPKVSLLWHTTCQLHCTTTQKWIHIARKICTWRDIANLRKPVNKAIEISISHSHQNLQIWLYTSHRLPGQVPRNFSEPNSQNSVQN